ncbi:GntR family transcriptional regulator [Lachnoclostridium sp. Marseille-P6806]|uniref:GntR family transcriptional regulator n=1 Tax=Lachnoclostridium sp. Marseille-P6806 TaxID=2364793 RepID=UPI001031860C|nr:GntR family transcriptional regulator [Lachnoclostridium sp. Marseille-P6806]
MEILLDYYSGIPIYEQICTQMKNQIMAGELDTDDPLPSIRNLAKDLRISVITTKRAYEELEKEGFLYKIAGKGCYVARRNEALVRENSLRSIEEKMEQIRVLAASAGLDREELLAMWDTIWEEA